MRWALSGKRVTLTVDEYKGYLEGLDPADEQRVLGGAGLQLWFDLLAFLASNLSLERLPQALLP